MNRTYQPQGSGRINDRPDRSDLWLVLGITLFGAALRLYNLGAASLWTDEAFSAWAAGNSLPDIWHIVAARESKPPLYYWLLHFWLAAGDNEATLRLMSVMFGTLVVPVVYAIGRILGGRDVAAMTAFLMSISPVNIHYSREARMYSFLAVAGAVSILGLAQLLNSLRTAPLSVGKSCRAGPSAPSGQRTSSWRTVRATAPWLAYIMGTTAALWVQYPAVFLPIAANFVVLGITRVLTVRARFAFCWVVAQVTVIALCIPLIPLYIHQSSGPNLLVPTPPPNPWTILSGLTPDFTVFEGAPRLYRATAPLELTLAAGAAALALRAWRGNRHWLVFTVGLWLIPLAGEIIVSMVWRPVLVGRTLIWSTIPLYLITSIAVTQLRRWPVYRAATLVVLMFTMMFALTVDYWRTPRREDWRPVAAYVARVARGEDIILFNDSLVERPFDYYFKRYHISVAEQGVPSDHAGNFIIAEPRMTNADIPALQSFAHGEKRLWLVYSHSWWTDPHGLVPAALGQVARLVDHKVFTSSREPIEVFLYEGHR
jgi:mannosyltransferase